MSALGETALLRSLMELAGEHSPDAVIGPGDDAAAWRPTERTMNLCSVDSLVENVDFRRRYQSPYQVGWKAWAAAVSDLSAMGASPRWGLVAALVPPETAVAALQAVQLGLVEAAALDGATILGGDLSRTAGPLALSVTVLGELSDGSPVRLDGGAAGDSLLVTGSLGSAAAALARLEAAEPELPAGSWARLLQPTSRVEAGRALRRLGAVAMTDVSDGLLLDLGRLCQASGTGAEIWLDRLPVEGGVAESLALKGGEDFELLAAFPPDRVQTLTESWSPELPGISVLGQLTAEPGIRLLRSRGGGPVAAPEGDGFRHF